ncbi:MAG: 30S ribosomal protein S6 [Bacilli bacterium]|nr:30S ribosomal protein S6 [Bacilli bacterium]
MRKYEIMFIVKPDLEEGAVKSVFDSVKTLLEEQKANIVEAKEMGQKELAYEVNKYKNGYYFYFLVETNDAKAVKEFDRVALINENIIRHLVVKVEE